MPRLDTRTGGTHEHDHAEPRRVPVGRTGIRALTPAAASRNSPPRGCRAHARRTITVRTLSNVELALGEASHTGLASGPFDLAHQRLTLINHPAPRGSSPKWLALYGQGGGSPCKRSTARCGGANRGMTPGASCISHSLNPSPPRAATRPSATVCPSPRAHPGGRASHHRSPGGARGRARAAPGSPRFVRHPSPVFRAWARS